MTLRVVGMNTPLNVPIFSDSGVLSGLKEELMELMVFMVLLRCQKARR
jgi:hypothetical protein